MNYEETMEFIESIGKQGWNFGLERTYKLLDVLGNPQKKLKCIHIAGTNGKGSISAMLNEILLEAGFRVGLYTSPCLEEYEERFRINNSNISHDNLAYYISKVKEAADKIVSSGCEYPTAFEIETCAMFLYFYEEKVDYAVVEVGLGGRIDSTNVIIPVLSLITSISYDHMNILGDTLSKIAIEKGGIIKGNVPLILYPQEKESLEVLKAICEEKNSEMILVPENSAYVDEAVIKNSCYQNITVNTGRNEYKIKLSLLGSHQVQNCAAAVFAAEELQKLGVKIAKENIIDALYHVKWPGRLEIMNKSPLIVIDGAHNIDGIRRLKESAEKYFEYEKEVLILGILADKQVDEMVSSIAAQASRIIAVTPHNTRAEDSHKLNNIISKYNTCCTAFDNYEKAFEYAVDCCGSKDLLLISGSLYMIGDMRKIINKYKLEGKI